VLFAHADGALKTHDRVMLANPDFGRKTDYGSADKKVIETTVGRVIFSEIWPEEMGFPNIVVGKAQLGILIWKCYKICGHEKTVTTLDKLKELGFREATQAGVSIGIDDMIIPKEKSQEIETAQKLISEVEKQHRKGVITSGERYNKIVDIWTHCTDQISGVMLKTFDANQGKREFNPISHRSVSLPVCAA
jgi:DNA-directed RNA polymerase subunit beta'